MLRCSKKAYAKCPARHLCGPIEDATFTEDSECAAFNREVEDKPMINADRIRAMSDEELAEVLAKTAYSRWTPWSIPFAREFCVSCPTFSATPEGYDHPLVFHDCDFPGGKCPYGSDVAWWLQQPSEEW